MTRSLRGVVNCVMLAAVLALPATASAQAEDEPFRRGLNARGDRRWPEAAQAMRQAIQINRTESTRKIQAGSRLNPFGRSTEYLPHYFLGEALKNAGDCAGAVTAFEVSEEQKVILGLPEYANLLRAGLKECASKGVLLRADYNQQIGATDQIYNETYATFQRIEKVREADQDLWRPDVQTEFERARGDMALAQKTLLKARQTRMVVDFAESRAISVRARDVLRPLEAKLSAAIGTRTLIAQQLAETQQVLAGAETTNAAIAAIKIALPSNLVTQRDTARTLVGRARERLGQAETTENTTTAGEALRLAHEASDEFTRVLEQVKKLERSDFELRFQQVLAGATEQLSFAGTSLAALERMVAEKPGTMTPEMASRREALVKEHSSLQRRFDNARRSENITGIQEAMKLAVEARTRIDALIRMFGPATLKDRGVDAGLEQGARHYLAGEYQQALGSLDPLVGRSDITFQVHVSVFRAASLYALYVRSGETNQTLRNDALAAIQRCKEIDPSFQPDPRAFSPRFLGFFESAGGSGAQVPASSSQ
jgi:hypothetical protein